MDRSRLLFSFVFIIIAALTIGVAISTYLLKEWSSFTGSLAVIAALLTVYSSLRLNWRLEDAHKPFINIYFDTKSHKYATSLVLRNDGGSTAYNIEIVWDTPLFDSDSKVAKFVGDGIDVYSLPVGEKASLYVNTTESFFPDHENTEAVVYSGILTYTSTPRSSTKIKQSFVLSMQSFGKGIMVENDQMGFYFENKQLTNSIKELKKEIAKISSKLGDN